MEDEYEEQSMSIEEFITAYQLPQRAKVTCGYMPMEDEDLPDFAADDVIDIYRVLCPFVSLSFTDPQTKTLVRISCSANYQDKFSIVSQAELKNGTGLYCFNSVEELIRVRPSVVTAVPEPHQKTTSFARSHRLRLIRLMPKIDGSTAERECEFRNLLTLKLFRLPLSFKCRFVEEKEVTSCTLRELVDIAPIERTLKFVDRMNISIPGIPKNYDGFLKLEKPKLLLKVKRIVDEPSEEDILETLLPVDTDIELSRREDVYTPKFGITVKLRDIRNLMSTNESFVIQIQSWDEETTILQNHVTRPGAFLLVCRPEKHEKIIARCDKRFFLIPVNHNGMLLRVQSNEAIFRQKVNASDLSKMSFPMRVKYTQSADYVNLGDDVLPTNETLTLEGVFSEETVVVSKMAGDVIQLPYHLPLRTEINVRFIRRWKTPDDRAMSERDEFVEEISSDLYDQLMPNVSADYEYPQTVPRAATTIRRQTLLEGDRVGNDRTAPVPPPRRSHSTRSNNSASPSTVPNLSRNRPPAPNPIVSATNSGTSELSRQVCMVSPVPQQRPLLVHADIGGSGCASDSEDATVVIPADGNISSFTSEEMLLFLRESCAPPRTISKWKIKQITGEQFARMTNEQLKQYDIGNPVFQFFRDKSMKVLRDD